MASFSNFLFGSKGRQEQLPRFTPEQTSALNQLLSSGLGNLDLGPIEEQARTKFQSQTVPSLAERFTSLGGGAQGSSAFQSALGRAGAGLEQGLAEMRPQLGLQQLQYGLTPQFESLYRPAQPGLLGGLASGGLQGLLQFLPLLLGGGQ